MNSPVHSACPQCGVSLEALALSCPECQTLVYADSLEALASEANAAAAANNFSTAIQSWRQALLLLPRDTVQFKGVQDRITKLEEAAAVHQAAEAHKQEKSKWLARLGPVGLIVWKFKTIGLLLLTKGKLLLLGFTKLPTLLTMFASFWLYVSVYSWPFALGLILSIYIHEMGHVAALKRFGLPATAPMFIPGFGAIVLMKQHPPTRAQDARVGLAGPVWGLSTAFLCFLAFELTGNAVWGAVAKFGAMINLFNMIPVWQLDGSRGYAALTKTQRGWTLAISALTWMLTGTGVLFLVTLGAVYRMFTKDAAAEPDRGAHLQYAGLIVLLGVLSQIHVPLP